jgi:hypothetical protein
MGRPRFAGRGVGDGDGNEWLRGSALMRLQVMDLLVERNCVRRRRRSSARLRN